MMVRVWNLFQVCIAITPTGAFAANFCPPPETLLLQVKSCEGNATFIDASNACLSNLNSEEKKRGDEIEAQAKMAESGQRKDTHAAEQSYLKTVQAMNELDLLAAKGKIELLAYEAFLALPSLEDAALMNQDGSLNSAAALRVECYANGMRGIRKARQGFVEKTAHYAARKNEAILAARSLHVDLQRLQATSSLVSPAKGHGQAPNEPVRKYPNRPSQITGKVRPEKIR